jgi:hypothetical protein
VFGLKMNKCHKENCYECWAEETGISGMCYHTSGCFLNKDGLVECRCGAIIYEEMGG